MVHLLGSFANQEEEMVGMEDIMDILSDREEMEEIEEENMEGQLIMKSEKVKMWIQVGHGEAMNGLTDPQRGEICPVKRVPISQKTEYLTVFKGRKMG